MEIDQMALVTLFLGWLLGILSPAIIDKINISRKRTDLYRAILSELKDTKIRLISMALILRTKAGGFTIEFFEGMRIELNCYAGYEDLASIRKATNQLDYTDPTLMQNKVNSYNVAATGGAVSLKMISTNIIKSNISNMHIFTNEVQSRIIEIQYAMDAIEQEMVSAKEYLMLTFTALSDENDAIIKKEIQNKYKYISEMSDRAVKRVNDFIDMKF